MSLYVKLKKRLGNFLLDVEFSSQEGSLGLLGASGCGKSLTLRSIAGIVNADEGKIILNDVTLFDSQKGINLPPQKRRVGYLFQNYALFPNMTVAQNIACGLYHEKNKSLRKKAVSDMIERMQLRGLEKHRPHQLSGGQQQRTALGRILVGQPEILMLDEPLSALDSHLKDQLLAELKSILKTFDKDTLIVTHSRDEAYSLCSTLAIMDKGRIITVGDTRDIFSDPGTRIGATITGCKNIAEAEKAGETLVHVPSWGITFDAGRPVRDKLCAIGIRAHYFEEANNLFNQEAKQEAEGSVNAFPIKVVEEIEEPFEWTIKFKYQTQSSESQSVWWRIAKGRQVERAPKQLRVDPKNIMLLYP